jgi:hypothetical protein
MGTDLARIKPDHDQGLGFVLISCSSQPQSTAMSSTSTTSVLVPNRPTAPRGAVWAADLAFWLIQRLRISSTR